jgi:hypothetical protein
MSAVREIAKNFIRRYVVGSYALDELPGAHSTRYGTDRQGNEAKMRRLRLTITQFEGHACSTSFSVEQLYAEIKQEAIDMDREVCKPVQQSLW